MREKKRGPLWSVWGAGVAVCLALMLTFFAGNESLAAREGRIKVEMANVRGEANQNSERVAQLPAGSTFTVTEETADANGSTWYHAVFTVDGAQKTGWVRADMVEITAEDVPEEPEGGEGQEPVEGEIQSGDVVIGGITLQEPDSLPESSDSLTAAQVVIGERTYSAMSVNPELTGQADFYLLYGVDEAGSGSWYFYDAVQGTLQRDVGQFSSEAGALLKALQEENEELKQGHDDALAFRNRIMIGLGIACLILFILVVVLAIKLSQVEYVDDDDADGDEDDSEDDDDEPIWMGAFRAKRDADRKRDEDDEDDLEESLEDMGAEAVLAAVMRSQGEPEDLEDMEELEEEPSVGVQKSARGKGRATDAGPGGRASGTRPMSGGAVLGAAGAASSEGGAGRPSLAPGAQSVPGGAGRPSGAPGSRPSQGGTGHPSPVSGARPAPGGTGRPVGAPGPRTAGPRPSGAVGASETRPAPGGTGRPVGAPEARPTQREAGRPGRTPGARPVQGGTGRPVGAPGARPTQGEAGRPSQGGTGRPSPAPGARPTQGGTGRPVGAPGARPVQGGAGRPAGAPGARATQGGTGRPVGAPGARPVQGGAGRPSPAPGAHGASGEAVRSSGTQREGTAGKTGNEKTEKAAVKAVQAQGKAMTAPKSLGANEDYEEDYDIEIVDLDDLDV
ncbi:MAG: SH3 domain-containing protein [Lachnospiraceae bacterium]|jgi:hypothetical protein|nr:SH3 domain-containing protein [Lachnospiraceae bacterium]